MNRLGSLSYKAKLSSYLTLAETRPAVSSSSSKACFNCLLFCKPENWNFAVAWFAEARTLVRAYSVPEAPRRSIPFTLQFLYPVLKNRPGNSPWNYTDTQTVKVRNSRYYEFPAAKSSQQLPLLCSAGKIFSFE